MEESRVVCHGMVCEFHTSFAKLYQIGELDNLTIAVIGGCCYIAILHDHCHCVLCYHQSRRTL